METVTFGEWAILRRRGARRIVIGFSTAHTPRGRFRYYSSLDSPVNDALLFNIPRNDWYTDGVPLGDGPRSHVQTLSFIRAVASGYDEVVFLGGSMGGYAALLYGSRFESAHILAMTPEIYPGVRDGFYARQGLNKLPQNLSVLFQNTAFKPWIISGEKKVSDLYCLSEVKSDRILTLKNVGHFVPPVVDAALGNLTNATSLAISGKLGEALQRLRGEMYHWPEVSSVMYAFTLGRLPAARAARYLELLPNDFYGRGYLALAVAKHYLRRRDSHLALSFAELAVAANPGDLEAHLVHDRAHLAVNGALPTPRFDMHVDDDLLRALDYSRPHAALLELHGTGDRRSDDPVP